jgi:hypothetical protein
MENRKGRGDETGQEKQKDKDESQNMTGKRNKHKDKACGVGERFISREVSFVPII